jgi:hypothetical protein
LAKARAVERGNTHPSRKARYRKGDNYPELSAILGSKHFLSLRSSSREVKAAWWKEFHVKLWDKPNAAAGFFA